VYHEAVLLIHQDSAELYALPWELVTIGAAGQHLGELSGVVLRYEWPETETTAAEPSLRPEGGRILVALSTAGGAVPSAEHVEVIERAYRDSYVEFDREYDVLVNASAQGLDDTLARAAANNRPYVILAGRRLARVAIWSRLCASSPRPASCSTSIRRSRSRSASDRQGG